MQAFGWDVYILIFQNVKVNIMHISIANVSLSVTDRANNIIAIT